MQAHQITAAKKLEILKNLTQAEADLDLKELQDELATLQKGTLEYERAYNQIRLLKAKLVNDLAALDRQAAADAKREASEEVSIWRGVVGEIENAESGLVRNIFSGRQRLSQSILQLGSEMVQKELANDLKAMTTRLLLGSQEEAAKKAMEQGGFLYHLFAEETKTAATATGAATRVATTDAAAVQSLAVEKTTTASTISTDAAKAAAGAYQSAAQIPFVGWLIAPVAAAAAFVAVEAFGSFDQGSWSVPQTGLAMIHEGETIIPAGAEGPPFSAGPPGGFGVGGSGGDMHFHAPLVQIMGNSSYSPIAIAEAVKKAVRDYHLR
ncbi:MAG TPA: hypothetical protein VKV96_12175 [Roseiarcus sp.]|nr:hypothetical protein [Roseiarcus sp.]